MYTVELYLFFEDCQKRDVIFWVIGLKHYNAGQFITLLNIRGDVNSWVRENQKIHEHQTPTNNDSTVPLPHHSGTKQQFTTEIFTNLNQHFQLKNTCF